MLPELYLEFVGKEKNHEYKIKYVKQYALEKI